jgi:surface polysaccharide O-acyltransferase-like enzyme
MGLSFKKNGSPEPWIQDLSFINEIMPHTDPPMKMLSNYTILKLSGGYQWMVPDDSRDTQNKFRIPDGTIMKAGGYLVFYETMFNDQKIPSPFGLSENGEEIYLFADTIDPLVRGYFMDFYSRHLIILFTFGRYINSAGEERFTIFSSPTLGGPNSQPAIGRVLITEIMYNALNVAMSISNKNISNQPVPLFDLISGLYLEKKRVLAYIS